MPQGHDRLEVEKLSAGDIGCVAKLKDTHTGDTFCRRDRPVRLPPIEWPESVATAAVVAKRGDEDKVAAALHKIHEEDPSFHFEYNSELGQTLIHGMGERHFDTVLGRASRAASASRRRSSARASPIARRCAQRPKGRASTRSRPAAAGSSATAGSGSSPSSGARATASWTRSWAG